MKSLKDLALAALVVGGLLVGVGTQHAAASSPGADAPAAPTLTGLDATAGGGLLVHYVNNAELESGFQVNLYSNAGTLLFHQSFARVAATGTPRTVEMTPTPNNGLEPGTRYCISMLAYRGDGTNESSVLSLESNRICATSAGKAPIHIVLDQTVEEKNPATQYLSSLGKPATSPQDSNPTLPDLSVRTVSGEQTLTQGLTSVYSIAVNNLGARPQTQVQVSIQVTGSVEYVSMEQTPGGWNCEGSAPILCTGPLGGSGDAVQTLVGSFQLRVRGAKAGVGTISVSSDPNDLIHEGNETNNDNQLVITVK
jgi:hypothetical protein